MKLTTGSILTSSFASVLAQGGGVNVYSAGPIISWTPKAPSSVDQSVVYNNTYYLSDRTNAGIHVVSLQDNTQTNLITGFVTDVVNGSTVSSASGPNGLVVLPDRNELWAGDGDGTIKVISLSSSTIIANITTGSKKRADEFAYDPQTGIVVVTNPNEEPPYVSVIAAANRTVLGKVMFNNASGLEQPAFNPATGTFYISVPSTGAYPNGCISTLNIINMSIESTYGLPPCVPAGIAFGPNQHLFVSCSQDQILNFGYAASYVVDAANNCSVIANISGLAGVDQVAYDSNIKLWYASAYQMLVNGSTPMPIVGIVNASTNELVQTIATDNVTAHSVAVNPQTNAMILPIKAKGIQIYNMGGGTGSVSTNTTGSASSPVASKTASGDAAQTFLNPVFALGIAVLVEVFVFV